MIHFVVDFLFLVKFQTELLIFGIIEGSLTPCQVTLFEPVDFRRQPSSEFSELNFQCSESLIALLIINIKLILRLINTWKWHYYAKRLHNHFSRVTVSFSNIA